MEINNIANLFQTLAIRWTSKPIKDPLPPQSGLGCWARNWPPLLTSLRLAISLSLHDSCLHLEGKERGDLDLPLHQAISPLSEGNPLDLDLGVALCFSFVLPLKSLPSISCFGWISERTWPLSVFLPLHLVHRFEFPTVIRGIEVRSLLILGA